MSLAWSLIASSNTMLMSLRTGAESWISSRLSRSMLDLLLPLAADGLVGFEGVDQIDDALFLAGVGLDHGLFDRLARGETGMDLVDAQQVAQVVDAGEVVRIGRGNGEDLVLEGQRQHLVDGRHRLGHELQRFGLRLEILRG